MLAAKWNEPKVTSTIFHMVEKHYAIPRAVIFRSECAACLPPRFPPQRATCLLHPAPLRSGKRRRGCVGLPDLATVSSRVRPNIPQQKLPSKEI